MRPRPVAYIQPEIKIRLRQPLRVKGILWGRGLVIPLPKSQAQQLVRMEVAEFARTDDPTAIEGAPA